MQSNHRSYDPVREGAAENAPTPTPPRFIADAMLGRLARWLRALGFDTLYAAAESDREIADAARRDDRHLLTRDRRLPREQSIDVYLVASESPLEQLREVMAHFGLEVPHELFTRCLVCNAELHPATPEEIANAVPSSLRGRALPVRRCPVCGRIYWEGSHTRRMRAALERSLLTRGSPGG